MTDTIRILHVDDDPDFLDLASTFLEQIDDRFIIETATNAPTGIDQLTSTSFDCIVSDYDMPGQTGIEFLQTVRDDHPNLPFILYTGKGSEEVASDAISAGVTDYLQKESGIDHYTVLANRIRNVVTAYRSQHEAARRQHRLEQTLKTVPACVVRINYDGQFTYANQRAEEVLGLEPDAVSERTYNDPEWDITDLDGNPIPDEQLPFRQVRDSGESIYGFRHTIEWPDGNRKVLSVNGSPLFDEEGNVVSTVFALTDITERRKREQELKDTTRQLEAVIENTPLPMFMKDVDGAYILANREYKEMFDLRDEDIIGKTDYDIHPTEMADEVHANDMKVIEQNESLELEERILLDGDERIYLSTKAPISGLGTTSDAATPEAVFGVATDITERKHQEQKLEQIIEQVTDAIVEVNANWEFTLVNEQAEELYDMKEEELLGQDFWDIFPEAENTRFEEEYRSVMETREPTSFVEFFTGLDGWFDIEAYPKSNGGIAFYFREVTDRIERSQEIERQIEQFRYVEEVADIGYWEIDTQTPEPHEVTLSEGVYHIHDLSPDEPFDVEKGIEYYHPDDRKKVRDAVEQAVTAGKSYEVTARLITNAGRERWMHSVGEPIERDGEIVTARGVFQDITEIKQKEEELARQNERLDEFASIVSHDLRNPLNLIDGRVELLKEEYESEHIDSIETAIDRMNRIIDDVLWLAREGEDIGTTESVSVRTAADSAWTIVADNAESVTLQYLDQEYEIPTVEADYDRLCQLFENLFRNALEHGGKDVTITIGGLEDGFYVEDDGPGIPENKREQVFDAGCSSSPDGTGFGLTIVSQVADAHGWNINLTAGTDGGARFEITWTDTCPS